MSEKPIDINDLPPVQQQEVEFHNKRMRPLVGGVIVNATVALDKWGDTYEIWPVLVVRLQGSGKEIQLEISRDPEGNGPGWIESSGLSG